MLCDVLLYVCCRVVWCAVVLGAWWLYFAARVFLYYGELSRGIVWHVDSIMWYLVLHVFV